VQSLSTVIEDKPLKASELKAWGVDPGSLTGELWRPLSEDGCGDEVRPSGKSGEVPRTEDWASGVPDGPVRADARDARGVDCAEERGARRFVGEDMALVELKLEMKLLVVTLVKLGKEGDD
jgi:hypothetical protein